MTEKARKAKTDFISGIIWMTFAVIYFCITFSFKNVEVSNTVGPGFMPRVVAGLIFLFALILMVRGITIFRKEQKKERKEESEIKAGDASGIKRCLLECIVLLFIAFFLKKLGFILTMIPAMFATFMILEKPDNRHIGRNILISVISPIVVYVVFYYLFSSLLPPGLLRPLLKYL